MHHLMHHLMIYITISITSSKAWALKLHSNPNNDCVIIDCGKLTL